MYECDISQYINETNRQFCIEHATKMYTKMFIQQHSTCHGLQTDVAVKSGVTTEPIKHSEKGTNHLLRRCGIHSQHCTFSTFQLTKLQKHILITYTLFKCYKNLFKILITNIITETAAHLCIVHPIKHAVNTCKVDSYRAMQLGSSLYIVHECVHTSHLKKITTDHTRVGIWRILLLSTQISRHMQAERTLSASLSTSIKPSLLCQPWLKIVISETEDPMK
jgi:hypothetical protein